MSSGKELLTAGESLDYSINNRGREIHHLGSTAMVSRHSLWLVAAGLFLTTEARKNLIVDTDIFSDCE